MLVLLSVIASLAVAVTVTRLSRNTTGLVGAAVAVAAIDMAAFVLAGTVVSRIVILAVAQFAIVRIATAGAMPRVARMATRISGAIAAAMVVIAIIAMAVIGGVSPRLENKTSGFLDRFLSGFSGTENGEAEETATEEVDEGETQETAQPSFMDEVEALNLWDGVHFYNADVADEPESYFDFGPSPIKKGKKVDYYVADFAERREKDPVLLAATMVALDGTLKTDFIGQVLYRGYDPALDMLQRADAAALVLAQDAELHRQAAEAVERLLGRANVELTEYTSISDQLYMNPDTLIDGLPGLVCYESQFEDQLCLVFTFQIKGGSNTRQKVVFHLSCGYQWTDGAEKIGVTPEENPQPPKKDDPDPGKPKKDKPKSDPSKPSKKDDPSPGKPSKKKEEKDPKKPTRKPKKDKKQGTQGEKVKPGEPDEDTNNPSNPQKSKADKSDSTTSQTHEQTKKEQKEKEEANSGSGQKKGGEESKPSTPKKEETKKVDNNGDKADKPTKKSDSGTAKGQDNDGHVDAPD